jgi:cytochrome c oxidase assembly protein subunit 15
MIERWRRILFAWFAVLTALAWMLIVVGALVRAHGAGLACPDWPLCFGQLVPTFDLKVGFEWGHRLFAGLLSLGLLTGAVLTWRQGGELWARAKRPIGVACLVFVVQAVLGGLTVLHLLASWTVTSHLLCGNAFAATLLWSALSLRDPQPVERSSRALGATVFAAGALLVQMASAGSPPRSTPDSLVVNGRRARTGSGSRISGVSSASTSSTVGMRWWCLSPTAPCSSRPAGTRCRG